MVLTPPGAPRPQSLVVRELPRDLKRGLCVGPQNDSELKHP